MSLATAVKSFALYRETHFAAGWFGNQRLALWLVLIG